MQVKAEGRLRHCFFGTYSAVIALGFEDAASAADAQKTLGPKWQIGAKSPKALVRSVSREELDEIKAQFRSEGFELSFPSCGWEHTHKTKRDQAKCQDMKEIDSVAHSIDYGPRFFLTIPIQAAQEQTSLFT